MLDVERSAFCRSLIEWTLHAETRPVEHVRVNHGCRNVFVTEQFLHYGSWRASQCQPRPQLVSARFAILLP
jgi:hypothetical protein